MFHASPDRTRRWAACRRPHRPPSGACPNVRFRHIGRQAQGEAEEHDEPDVVEQARHAAKLMEGGSGHGDLPHANG